MGAATRAKELFLEALDHPSEVRVAFVSRVCVGDESLEMRVHQLLAIHEEAEVALPTELLRETTGGGVERARVEHAPGDQIDRYRILEKLGEGGFGLVYLAEQEEPLRRQVALKVVKAGMDTRAVIARFEVERRALALMDHPSIARVFDAGATPEGRPFFVMELVAGEPITTFCKRAGLSLAQRLELFVQVCRAVQHAHQKGIVHRDLKPSNILVSRVDGVPTPKVIDFGIAKPTDEEQIALGTILTQDGALIGTPEYMSPEQVTGIGDLDTRTDVYALGVLLYEMACGVRPFDDDELRAEGLVGLQRIVRDVVPPRPSARLARIAAEAGSGEARRQRSLVRTLAGDLDWIAMCCLEKDRDRRYVSAEQLALEVERLLRGEPVQAGPPTLTYRARRFVHRQRSVVATAAGILALLVTMLFVYRERAIDARNQLSKFQQTADFLSDILLSVDPAVAQGRDRELIVDVLERAAVSIEERDLGPAVEATLRTTIGGSYASMAEYELALPHYLRAHELQEDLHNELHFERLQAGADIGGVYLMQRDFEGAEPWIRAAAEGFARSKGRYSEEAMGLRAQLATLLAHSGQHGEAEDLFQELVAVQEERLGPNHEDTLLTLNNYAELLSRLERDAESLPILERVLAGQIETVGETHPRTLSTMSNLASAHMDLGELEAAERGYRRALEGKLEIYEADHPSVLIGRNNLGNILRDLGHLAEAEEEMREGLAVGNERFGSTHPFVLTIELNLGQLLLMRGQFEESEERLHRAARGFGQQLGLADARTIQARDNLAEVLLELGRPREALPWLQGVADVRRTTGGTLAQAVGLFLEGWALLELGQLEEAEDRLLEAHPLLVMADRGGDHLPRLCACLVRLYEAMDLPDEAEPWRQELFEH